MPERVGMDTEASPHLEAIHHAVDTGHYPAWMAG
jgi:hypothetical protein